MQKAKEGQFSSVLKEIKAVNMVMVTLSIKQQVALCKLQVRKEGIRDFSTYSWNLAANFFFLLNFWVT